MEVTVFGKDTIIKYLLTALSIWPFRLGSSVVYNNYQNGSLHLAI